MTVYVESNFVLEIALGQEQSIAADAILERAAQGEVALALPAFSLSEPFSTVTQRSRDMRRLENWLSERIRDLARSRPHQDDARLLESAPTVLARIEAREIEQLTLTVRRLLAVAIVIPVDVQVFDMSVEYRDRFAFSPQDALIYATVINHLRSGRIAGPHYFINKDREDFKNPAIRSELEEHECELLRTFEEGALRLEATLPSS